MNDFPITNPAAWHLALNHVPVMASLFGFLLLSWSTMRRSRELGVVSFFVIFVSALITVPVYLTGDPTKELVKHLPGVSRAIIHQHSDAAFAALWGEIGLGILAATGLLASRQFPRIFKACQMFALIGAALVSAWMLWTGHLGGLIHHPEIRGNNSPATADIQKE